MEAEMEEEQHMLMNQNKISPKLWKENEETIKVKKRKILKPVDILLRELNSRIVKKHMLLSNKGPQNKVDETKRVH